MRAASTASASRLPSPVCAHFGERRERPLDRPLLRSRLKLRRRADLRVANGGVVDFEHGERRLFFEPVGIDADDDVLAGVDARLLARGGFLDAHLGNARLDGLHHAAELLHLLMSAQARCISSWVSFST